ncbi:MAG TPA: protein phosphatase 2C domain-containing protein [Acidimicrobiia bacterium]|nr:protein phosphatase 2C domain-containing protein [Acidimicrobiia bacterium]
MDDRSDGNGSLAAHAASTVLAWALCSEPGPVRQNNEDFAGAYVSSAPEEAWERPPLFAVADGMGGHAAGEVASRIAVERALELWSGGDPSSGAAGLRTAARAANLAVIDAADSPERRGMGTTLTLLTMSGREATIAHVGDSRVYRIRDDSCTQLTSDHSRAGDMLRMKLITAEQAAVHPARSQLTRSLGHDPLVQVDVYRERVVFGDVFVLCSDGLWDVVGRDDFVLVAQGRISSAGSDRPTPAEVAGGLVGIAIERGAADNVTAVVVQVTSDRPVPPEPRRGLFRRRS